MTNNRRYTEQLGSPMKRARTMNHLNNVQRISRTILQSITNEQRSEAFVVAQKALDHKIEALHDIEVQEGIVSSLCLQLGYVLNKGDPELIDIASVFSIIAMVYQCSDEIRDASFSHVGIDLLRMMFSSFHLVQNTDYFGWASYHIMKVMRSLSRLKDASIVMTQHDDALTILQIVILDEAVNLGAKLEAIATLKNITFFAEDFRLRIMSHPGLFDALIKTCTDRDDNTGREFATAVIRNMAMVPDTKIPMVEHSCLLDVLVELMDDQNLKTRRNAVSAMGSLAIAEENSVIFVTHGEGVLLRILKRLVEEDDDAVIRRRAARALRCFGREETVGMIVDTNGIVESLCAAAMNDPSVEAQIEAIEALATFVSHANIFAPYYKNILDAIIKIASCSPPPSCVQVLLKTMNILSCKRDHRQPMIQHCDLLHTVTVLASDPSGTNTCRELCSSTIYNLTCDEEHRGEMSSKVVLSFLLVVLSEEYRNERLSQTYAVKALENLASYDTNRKCLANETGLLQRLMNFAAVADNSDTKEAAKFTLIQLIPLL